MVKTVVFFRGMKYNDIGSSDYRSVEYVKQRRDHRFSERIQYREAICKRDVAGRSRWH